MKDHQEKSIIARLKSSYREESDLQIRDRMAGILTMLSQSIESMGYFEDKTIDKKIDILNFIFLSSSQTPQNGIEEDIIALRDLFKSDQVKRLIGANGRPEVQSFFTLDKEHRAYLFIEAVRNVVVQSSTPEEVARINSYFDGIVEKTLDIAKTIVYRLTDPASIYIDNLLSRFGFSPETRDFATTMSGDYPSNNPMDVRDRRDMAEVGAMMARRGNDSFASILTTPIELVSSVGMLLWIYENNYFASFQNLSGSNIVDGAISGIANLFLTSGLILSASDTVRDIRDLTQGNGNNNLRMRVFQGIGMALGAYLQSQQNDNQNMVESSLQISGAMVAGRMAGTVADEILNSGLVRDFVSARLDNLQSLSRALIGMRETPNPNVVGEVAHLLEEDDLEQGPPRR